MSRETDKQFYPAGVDVAANLWSSTRFSIGEFPSTSPNLSPMPTLYMPDGQAGPEDIAELLGLGQLTLEQAILFTNQVAEKQNNSLELIKFAIENPDGYSPEELEMYRRMLKEHEQFYENCRIQESLIEAYVNNPNNYEFHALEIIRERKQKAADFTEWLYSEEIGNYYAEKYHLPIEEARNFMEIVFLNLFSDGEERVTDVDDTVTANAGEYLKAIVPGGQEAERLIDAGGNTAEAIKKTFSKTRLGMVFYAPQMFRWAARHTNVKIRQGADSFFASADGKITVISASFLPFVYGVLDKLPSVYKRQVDVHVYAVSPEHIFSMQKDLIVSHIGKSNPRHVTKFKGDGGSDFVVVKSEELDYIWALRDSSLHKKLSNPSHRHIPYLTYTSDDNSAEVEAGIREEVILWKNILSSRVDLDSRQ